MAPFHPEPSTTDARIAEAGMNLLAAFAAVCGAPDDETVADQANQALAVLDGLVTAPDVQAGR